MLSIYRSVVRFLFSALALAMTIPTQAATYVGSWDPLYGADFPGLYWSGSAVFDISSDCVGIAGGGLQEFYASSCSSAELQSATVEFQSPPGTLNWTNNDPFLWRFLFDGDQLVGVYTDQSSYRYFSSLDVLFSLQFTYELQYLVFSDCGGPSDPCQYVWESEDDGDCDTEGSCQFIADYRNSVPTLYWREDGCETDCRGGQNDRGGDFEPRLRFSAVPEPGTLTLLSLAIAGVAAGVRRRRHYKT